MPPDERFPPGFFDQAYTVVPGWEIGRPQPDLVGLLDEFPPSGRIVDVGCGTGALAVALGLRGHSVLGVDLAAKAIEKANAALAQVPGAAKDLVSFRVADGLALSELGPPFGAVIDSGFYHLFGDADREQFVRQLVATLGPGGRYYLLGFAVEGNYPNAPRQVTLPELTARFSPADGWRVLALRTAGFLSTVRPEPIPATLACFERTVVGGTP